MNFSNERLMELLVSANRKVKSTKLNMIKLAKQRNNLQYKLVEIERILINTDCYFGKYDRPSSREIGEAEGKLELKEKIFKIIESK